MQITRLAGHCTANRYHWRIACRHGTWQWRACRAFGLCVRLASMQAIAQRYEWKKRTIAIGASSQVCKGFKRSNVLLWNSVTKIQAFLFKVQALLSSASFKLLLVGHACCSNIKAYLGAQETYPLIHSQIQCICIALLWLSPPYFHSKPLAGLYTGVDVCQAWYSLIQFWHGHQELQPTRCQVHVSSLSTVWHHNLVVPAHKFEAFHPWFSWNHLLV